MRRAHSIPMIAWGCLLSLSLLTGCGNDAQQLLIDAADESDRYYVLDTLEAGAEVVQ